MNRVILLREVAEALEMQAESSIAYYDRETGEIHHLSEEEFSAAEAGVDLSGFPDWQRPLVELAQLVETDASGRFVALPTKFDLHEYHFLESFAESVTDPALSSELFNAIRGRGAFRYFKDTVRRLGLEAQWFKHRAECFREAAREWCDSEQVAYREGG